MAKVAFDVQGTLKGARQYQVVELFKVLEQRGHQLFIWSYGGYTMAFAAARGLSLKAEPMDKIDRDYTPGAKQEMDVCVDDERNAAEVLSADKMIDVSRIPNTVPEILEFIKEYNL